VEDDHDDTRLGSDLGHETLRLHPRAIVAGDSVDKKKPVSGSSGFGDLWWLVAFSSKTLGTEGVVGAELGVSG
jgi:hypothetical protein